MSQKPLQHSASALHGSLDALQALLAAHTQPGAALQFAPDISTHVALQQSAPVTQALPSPAHVVS
jgi:hypothetical protein